MYLYTHFGGVHWWHAGEGSSSFNCTSDSYSLKQFSDRNLVCRSHTKTAAGDPRVRQTRSQQQEHFWNVRARGGAWVAQALVRRGSCGDFLILTLALADILRV